MPYSIRYFITLFYRGHLISDNLEISPSTSSSTSISPPSSPQSESTSSKTRPTHFNYWTRKLMKMEDTDPFRWGHSGYKEQHPSEFISSESEEEEGGVSKKHKIKKRSRESSKKHRLKDKEQASLKRKSHKRSDSLPRKHTVRSPSGHKLKRKIHKGSDSKHKAKRKGH